MTDAAVPDFSDRFEAADTMVRIRPIRPDDREREAAFVRALSPASRYFRFHSAMRSSPATNSAPPGLASTSP